MDEELKQQIKALILEMLGKADEKIKNIESAVTALTTKADKSGTDFTTEIKSLKDELTKTSDQYEDMKNELADLELKGSTPTLTLNLKEQTELTKKAVKTAVAKFLKEKDNYEFKANPNKPEQNLGTELKEFIDLEFKVLNLTNTGEGLESVDEVLSREIIERARESYPIVGAVGSRNMPRSLRQEVLISYPSVQEGIENVAGANISETDTQTYAEVVNNICKINAKPRITDEAMLGSDLDLYGHLLTLLNDEVGRRLASQILFGNGSGKNMRGILSSNRLDITNLTGQSWKATIDNAAPANARNPDFYATFATGVSGQIGATDKDKVDYLIDIETALPTTYLKNAKYTMNRRTLAQFRKVRDANDNPIFSPDYRGSGISLNGYPVEIDDSMPDVVADAPFLIFGDLKQAFFVSNGDIDKMVIDNITVDGCTVVKLDKEYFEMVGKNDAIIIGVATTNAGS